MPAGRPTKFKKEIITQAIKLAAKGFTDKDLAEFFDVAESTIGEWKKKYPEFSVPLKEAKNEADEQVEGSLFHRANGYSHQAVKIFNDDGSPLVVPYTEHYPPDTTACIFWLKNRQPAKWREKQEIEHSGGPLVAVIKTGDE